MFYLFFELRDSKMEILEPKKINGKTYYYYSKWAWKDGRCRRVWQKYLGKPGNIAKAVQGAGPAPLFAEIFHYGLPTSLWNELSIAQVVKITNTLCQKRQQGLSVGEYLSIAAINRAICPKSKNSIWEWFSKTTLFRQLPLASKKALSSQRFWDHMDKINGHQSLTIWKNILAGVIKREKIDLSSVSYDGTNFYTFIDTFNFKCRIASRGKNKQGRNNLRQINYALFCCSDGHMPLFYDIYQGNRNDARQFPLMLKQFNDFINEISQKNLNTSKITLIFDKGNNSAENFSLIDSFGLNYVGSVKLEEHKELARISNNDESFRPCNEDGLEGVRAFRVKKNVYGKQRVLVVVYSNNLFNAQFLTLQNDIAKAIEKLSLLHQKLQDRANGVVKRGKVPTVDSLAKQCRKILKRQYMKKVIKVSVQERSGTAPRLEYAIDAEAFHKLSNTYIGKNIIITNREDWNDTQIIKAYRSQFIIEDVFKEMKDRCTGSWWPLHHWTDSKIKVHALYCTIALLLRALMHRRVSKEGINISMKRVLEQLDAIREVINFYPLKRGSRKHYRPTQTVFTKTNEIQRKLMEILKIRQEKTLF
jgi:transposase